MDETVLENANVSLVGEYTPSAYGFQTDAYWIEKELKITSLRE